MRFPQARGPLDGTLLCVWCAAARVDGVTAVKQLNNTLGTTQSASLTYAMLLDLPTCALLVLFDLASSFDTTRNLLTPKQHGSRYLHGILNIRCAIIFRQDIAVAVRERSAR